MKKSKLVIYNDDYGARIYPNFSLDDIGSLELRPGDVVVENADTKLVDHLPPEFWANEGSNVMLPLTNPKLISRRMLHINTKPMIKEASKRIDLNIERAFEVINEIPNKIGRESLALENCILSTRTTILKELNNKMLNVSEKLRDSAKWHIIIVVLLGLALISEGIILWQILAA